MATAVLATPVVCIIDDDEAVRDSLHVLLLTRGLGVRTFESARSFLAEAESLTCHCMLIDMHMPEMTGLALLLTLRAQGNQAPAIVVTGGGDQALADQVERAGALGLLRKPVSENELFTWVDRALDVSRRDGGCGAAAP